MSTKTGIVWYRQDLRVEDNAALAAALAREDQVVPVFVWEEEGEWALGAASRWWLSRSLADLDRRLRERGSRLIVRRGDAREIIPELIARTKACSLYLNRRYEPGGVARDEAVTVRLASDGIDVYVYNDSLLFDPDEVRTGDGDPYRVFTPFWKKLLSLEPRLADRFLPERIPGPKTWPESTPVSELETPRTQNDPSGLDETWVPGESAAGEVLDRFLDGPCERYEEDRDLPGKPGTSALSPYLHFGDIGPRRVWTRTLQRAGDKAAHPFLRQIAWREFAHHLLHHFPHTVDQPLRSSFERFPWREDDASLAAWKAGRTGYPVVDAGMRQLKRTGWMHNRVRMIAASFLVKDLLIDWRLGARWFWETLVDADLANNTLGWQWVAGCGADAAPFFRVFNPVLQGQKFDPDGDYVRRWVPELRGLPNAHLHAPWKSPASTLESAGVRLGADYPVPIVDHSEARQRALDSLASVERRVPAGRGKTRRGAAQ